MTNLRPAFLRPQIFVYAFLRIAKLCLRKSLSSQIFVFANCRLGFLRPQIFVRKHRPQIFVLHFFVRKSSPRISSSAIFVVYPCPQIFVRKSSSTLVRNFFSQIFVHVFCPHFFVRKCHPRLFARISTSISLSVNTMSALELLYCIHDCHNHHCMLHD